MNLLKFQKIPVLWVIQFTLQFYLTQREMLRVQAKLRWVTVKYPQ